MYILVLYHASKLKKYKNWDYIELCTDPKFPLRRVSIVLRIKCKLPHSSSKLASKVALISYAPVDSFKPFFFL